MFVNFDLTGKHKIKLVFENRRVNFENDGKHVRENDLSEGLTFLHKNISKIQDSYWLLNTFALIFLGNLYAHIPLRA